MTFTFRLQRTDGAPADPPTIRSGVTNWRVGDTIPFPPDRTLRVIGIRPPSEDENAVLIVEDAE